MDLSQIVITRLGGNPRNQVDHIGGRTRHVTLGRWFRGYFCHGFSFWAASGEPGHYWLLANAGEASVHPDVVDFYWHKNGMPKRGYGTVMK